MDLVIHNVDEVMYNTNNSIIPEDRNLDLVNEENEKSLLPDCDDSGIDTVVKKKVLNEILVNVKSVSEIVLNDEVTDVEEQDVGKKMLKRKMKYLQRNWEIMKCVSIILKMIMT